MSNVRRRGRVLDDEVFLARVICCAVSSANILDAALHETFDRRGYALNASLVVGIITRSAFIVRLIQHVGQPLLRLCRQFKANPL